MSWATSLFSGSFSLPMTKWTRPEVFRRTEAAYAWVTPTRLAESTWREMVKMVWLVTQLSEEEKGSLIMAGTLP